VTTAAWQTRLDRLKRAGRALTAVGAVLGAAAACQTFITPPHPDITGTTQTQLSRAAQVCAFATEFITVWLPATEADRLTLTSYLTLPAAVKLPKTAALGVDAAGCFTALPKGRIGATDVYAVFVSTLQRPYPAAAAARGFYQVPVGLTGGQPRALGPPTPRGVPGPGLDVKTRYPTVVDSRHPTYSLVAGFVAAYLTGTPALDRYIAADSGLTAVGGYQSVQLSAVAATGPIPTPAPDAAVTHVLAQVTARTISPDVYITYSYPLTLTAAGGTWMVKTIDTIPQLGTDTAPVDTEAPQ